MQLKAVIWDVDGTLVSTKDLYLECYRRALAPYVGKLLSDEELLALRPHSEIQVLRLHSGSAFEECSRSFRNHYAELHASHFGGIYDGIAEVLDQLREQGIRNGIVTGKSRSSWEITIAEIELGNFDVVIADDDVANPKPDPEGILTALRDLHVPPEDAMYVGDSPGDMEAAHAAGVTAVAAMWSKSDAWRERFIQRTRDMPPFLMMDHPSEILRLFGAATS
jgi:HAD superfamily hydrolase (TIGR01509 family)